ncbi:Type II secretion system protein D [invertebrate metagenome]|uniref:Type II secretion system protein D n=1 Tax=invertebrate metagenome TaxID=1711999 RepID=A0A2H9T440_9ZZZZ
MIKKHHNQRAIWTTDYLLACILILWSFTVFAEVPSAMHPVSTAIQSSSKPVQQAPKKTQSIPTKPEKNTQNKLWTLNQQNADIREFIAQVAKITGETFVVDPRIKSGNTVTVISSKPLAKDEVYDVFLEVLAANGFTVIPKGQIINVIPNTTAKTTSPNSKIPLNTIMATRVIQLHSVSSVEVIPIIRPLIAQYGHAAASASGNAVIISDLADNVKRITNLIRELDDASNNDYEVIQLKHAWVGDIAKIIQETLATGKGQFPSGLQVIAEERSNRLVIKGNANKRIKVRKLVDSLDQEGIRKSTTKVIFLNYADAKNIAEILSEASASIQSSKDKDSSNTSPPMLSPRAMGSSKDNLLEAGKSAKNTQSNIFVKADETQNAIVLIADPETLQSMEQIVKQLDVPRSQVLLEAAIVEVSGGIDDTLGIQWGIDGTKTIAQRDGSSSGTLSKITGNLFDNSSIKMGAVALRGANFGVLISALSRKNNNNILSTPSLLTMDNQEAEFLVGKNIPIKTGSYASSGSSNTTGNPFTTTDRRDVGIKLKVTPHLNKDSTLKLEIEQEVSSLDGDVSRALASDEDIIFNNRTLKTAVMVDNKQTIVIGGLIQDDRQKLRQKVPLLGDIPLLGNLFKYNQAGNSKRNLMLFIRPTVMRDATMLAQTTNEQFTKLKTIQQKELDIKSDYFPDTPSRLFEKEAFDIRSKDKWIWQQ